MRLDARETIDKLVEGYRASLEDGGDFIESEFNSQCGADLFEYDHEADELVLREDLENHPHYRVEYDLDYWGGDYHKVGQFAFIPEGMEFALNSVEEAFEKLTGIDRQHIIQYSIFERFRPDGMEFQE